MNSSNKKKNNFDKQVKTMMNFAGKESKIVDQIVNYYQVQDFIIKDEFVLWMLKFWLSLSFFWSLKEKLLSAF